MSNQLALGSLVYSQLAGTAGTALTSMLYGGTADPTVFFGQAPDNQATPYVVYLFPNANEDNTSSRRLKDTVVRVYAVATSNADVAGSIDAQIDARLHHAALGSAGGWNSLRCQRENDYQLVSTSESGVRYYTSGADYRVNMTTTS